MPETSYSIRTALGDALCIIDGDALCGLKLLRWSEDRAGAAFERRVEATSSAAAAAAEHPLAAQVQNELDEYFAGNRREFTIPLQPQGTDFQRRVWDELLQIPWGTTLSYSELTLRLGDIKALRAVGRANGANPVWIIIPCHRVIGANGELTGYAGGLNVKRRLLELEGVLQPGLFGGQDQQEGT